MIILMKYIYSYEINYVDSHILFTICILNTNYQ
jgi:hypothetical protein